MFAVLDSSFFTLLLILVDLDFRLIQGRHLLKMIGRALMLIFTTSKPFLPCNAIGIMLKFRNYW